jgi:hypothetical protein
LYLATTIPPTRNYMIIDTDSKSYICAELSFNVVMYGLNLGYEIKARGYAYARNEYLNLGVFSNIKRILELCMKSNVMSQCGRSLHSIYTEAIIGAP